MQKKILKHMGQQTILKFRSNSCFVRVHHAVKHWQKGFLESKVVDEVSAMGGHFPVLAISNGRVKKFLVALNFLACPPFVKLLEAAEQEFGFDQPGVLVSYHVKPMSSKEFC